MIEDTGFDLARRAALGNRPMPAKALNAAGACSPAQLRWGMRLAAVGRGCLIVFAAVALINANREAGLLTLGSLAQVSSVVRGGVQLGVVFLILPVSAVLWVAGQLMIRHSLRQHRRWRLGSPAVTVPLAILITLTLAHLSLTIGWADVAFVLAGLGLLALTYVFVLNDRLSPAALAGFVAVVGGLQAAVGVGQFMLQHDLGLRWLGELSLNPATPGVSVLADSARVLRAYGLMRHPNALGAILPLSLLAAISLWLRAGKRGRVVWLIVVVDVTGGLVLSFSRSGWLATLAGGGVLLAAQRPPGASAGGSSRRPMWITCAPALLAILLVVMVAVSFQPGLFLGRLTGGAGAGAVLEHRSLLTRLSSAQMAWEVIRRWPLWGVGTRRYVVVVAQLMHVTPSESLLVDSTPLILWAEQGLAGPVAWLGMGLVLVWRGLRRAGARAVGADLALAAAWLAAIQVVCLFQAFYWPSQGLWQGGIWLGAALGLWARASASSASQSANAAPAAPARNLDCGPARRESSRRPGAAVPHARRPGLG